MGTSCSRSYNADQPIPNQMLTSSERNGKATDGTHLLKLDIDGDVFQFVSSRSLPADSDRAVIYTEAFTQAQKAKLHTIVGRGCGGTCFEFLATEGRSI